MTITNGYCAQADLKEQLGDTNSVLNSNLLDRAINSSSRAIDRYCGRRFWQDQVVQAKTYRPNQDWWLLWTDDISTTTGLIIKTDTAFDGSFATTWQASDYQLEPTNAATEGTAYAYWKIRAVGNQFFPTWYRWRDTVQVTAKFGWSAIPDQVTEACLLMATALLKRKDTPFGVMGFTEFGTRLLRTDPQVASLLAPYRKVGV